MVNINLNSIREVFRGVPVTREVKVAKFQTRVTIYIEAEKQPMNNRIWNTGKIGAVGFVGFEAALALLDQTGGLGAGSGLKNALEVGSPFATYIGLGSSSVYLLGKEAAQKFRKFVIVRSLKELETADRQAMVEFASKESPKLAKALELQMSKLADQEGVPLPMVISPVPVKKDAQLAAGIQEELGRIIVPAEPKKKPETIESLRLRIEAVRKELETKVADKESQLTELRGKLNAMIQKESQMETQIAQMNVAINGLRTEKEGMVAQIAQLKAENAGLAQKVTEQEKALQSMHENFDKKGKAEIARLTADIKALESRMTVEINKKNDEIVTLKTEKDQLEAKVAGLEKERGELNKKITKMGVEALQLGEIITGLQQDVAEGKEVKTKLEAVTREKADLEGRLGVMSLDMAKKDSEIAALTTERKETAQFRAQIKEKTEALVRGFNEEKARLTEEIGKLRAGNDKEGAEKIKALEDQIEALKAQIEETEARHKAEVEVLGAKLATASETTAKTPVNLTVGAAVPIEGVKEFDEILGLLKALPEFIEEIKGKVGQPSMSLFGVQQKVSHIIAVLTATNISMKGTFIDHKKMLAEIKRLEEIRHELLQAIEKLHSDAQKYKQG